MIYETKTLPSGFKVEVHYQENAENPRRAFGNVGTLAISNKYKCYHDFGVASLSSDELQEIASDENLLKLPVYLFSHSGLSVNTTGFSCKWDSGQVGYIYISKEDAKRELPTASEEKILAYLKDEIETLNNYLQGEVFGYVVIDPDGEEVDSCWGYYGDAKYCMDEGEEAASGCEKYAKKQAQKRCEDFEKWFASRHPDLLQETVAKMWDGKRYISLNYPAASFTWEAWKASRKALK